MNDKPHRHTTWTELKARRASYLQSPEGQRAYRQAGLALTVAQRVYDLRIARGWSEADLASRLGESAEFVERLEGSGIPLDLELLDRLSLALEKRLVIDFAETDERQPTRPTG